MYPEREERRESSVTKFVNHGISAGCALAMVISYDQNHSVLYAVLHGLCSWGYVIYHLVAH